jgi:hypothetical protein
MAEYAKNAETGNTAEYTDFRGQITHAHGDIFEISAYSAKSAVQFVLQKRL